MAWRAVMIQNPAKVSLHKGQLTLETEAGAFTIPLEDITALILESPQITLTSSVMAACQDTGIALITCDQTHTPNGLLLPFLPHSRHSLVAKTQLSWSEPLRKRLWQKIVQTKISNQAACLEATLGANETTHLRHLATRVGSGDPDNIEAQAAKDYWQRLFGKGFKRGNDDLIINAALNYGYAVVRASVARSQVAYGLLPAFGVHHDNALNAFNLTDDMMEVLRPQVDYLVYQLDKQGAFLDDLSNLSKTHRQQLAAIGHSQCLIDGQIQTLSNTCDKMAASLVSAIEGKSPALLSLAQFSGNKATSDDNDS